MEEDEEEGYGRLLSEKVKTVADINARENVADARARRPGLTARRRRRRFTVCGRTAVTARKRRNNRGTRVTIYR